MARIVLFLVLLQNICYLYARCPNWCNQRGICTSPHDGGFCDCFMGFTSEDCSQRWCPFGYDPMQASLNNITLRRTVLLETGSLGGMMTGRLEFTFAGSSAYLDADFNQLDDVECKRSLQGLKSISDVSCSRQTVNEATGVGSFLISLLSFPVQPYFNNLIVHNGNPPNKLFHCNISQVDDEEAQGPYCSISDVSISDEAPPLYAECSNHGECDRVYGTCSCEKGFKGPDCNNIKDADDIVKHFHDGPFFTGSLMSLHAERKQSAGFNLLQSQIDHQLVTTIGGDRLLTHRGDVKVVDGSLTIKHSTTSGEDGVSPAYHIIAYDHADTAVYTLDSAGDSVQSGSFSAANRSFTVEHSLVTAQNLKLMESLDVVGSANVENSLTIGSGFALTPGGMTVDVVSHSGTLFELRSRQVDFKGSLLEIHSMGDNDLASMLKTVANGVTTFEITSAGVVKMQALKLVSGGVDILSGGLRVQSGGLMVKGGLTIAAGGLDLEGQRVLLGGVSCVSRPSDTNNNDSNNNNHNAESLFGGEVLNEHYVGNIIDIKVTPQKKLDYDSENVESRDAEFSFLRFAIQTNSTQTKPSSVFEVSSDGSITSSGGAAFSGVVNVQGASMLQGMISFKRSVLVPTSKQSKSDDLEVVVPADATYCIIAAAATSTNEGVELTFAETSTVFTGRIVVITNTDKQTTTGAIKIPPMSTILAVFDGQKWTDVQALKAPMETLSHVKVFEAANDLHIGNHTFTAKRLQATELGRNGVLFAGSSGMIVQADKFTFTKGVLSIPSLKVEKLLSSFDAKGHEISNVLLSNSKIEATSISSREIIIPSQRGLAFFDNNGALAGSNAVSFDTNGNMVIKELISPLNARGHVITSAVLTNVTLAHVTSAAVEHLYLTAAQVDPSVALVPFLLLAPVAVPVASNSNEVELNEVGEVVVRTELKNEVQAVATNAIGFDSAENSIYIHSLKVDRLVGPLDVNGQVLSNAVISGGSLSNIDGISAKKLVLTGLQSASKGSNRLAFLDSNGQITAQASSSEWVSVTSLSVDRIRFAASNGPDDDVDFSNKMLKNVRIHSDSIQFGPLKDIQVGTLEAQQISIANKNPFSSDSETVHLVVSNSAGKFLYSDLDIHVRGKNVLDMSANKLISGDINIRKNLVIDSAKSASLLGTDSDGKVVDVNTQRDTPVEVNTLRVNKAIHAAAGGDVFLHGLKSGVLVVDDSSKLTSMATYVKELKDSNRNNLLQIEVGTVHAGKVEAEIVTASRAVLEEVFLVKKQEIKDRRDESNVETRRGIVVSDSKDGKLGEFPKAYFDSASSELHVKAIKPFKEDKDSGKQFVLAISDATLSHSNISHSFVHNSPQVSTDSLVVNGFAEFFSDVVIDGSITVHGSVIGSGPYMDSSDKRFKTNILPLNNSLDAVCRLQGVRYDFKVDEFPDRHFPHSGQIGWIADDLVPIVPELVNQDGEGYLAVSYAHATVLIAEAVRELKEQKDNEIAALKRELQELRDTLQLLVRSKAIESV